MKKLLTASLPALVLLALGGCTATRSVATTEDDGVYYSSEDRTTAVVRPAPAAPDEAAPAASNNSDNSDEATNPDYQAADTRRQARNAPEYYDDSYSSSSYDDDSRFRRPYAGPTVGLAYYSPPVVLAPAIVSYGFPAYGGYGGYGSGFYDPYYSSFASPFYNPYGFYDPFFSPFGYGYGGSFVNINIGFGRPWGGYGYGRPNYGGYGAYAYDPYYGGYGRGYGNGGYGGYYGGSRQVIRPNGSSYANTSGPVLVGPRRGRGGDVLAGRGNAVATPGNTPALTSGRGRRGGMVASPAAPIDGLTAPTTTPASTVGGGTYGRRRLNSEGTAPNSPTAITDQPAVTGRRGAGRLGSYETTAPTPSPTAEANAAGGRSRRRSRDLNEGAATGTVPGYDAGRRDERFQQADVQPLPTEQRPARRSRLFESAPADNGQGQATRTYERPAEQPQPRRSYERPQRTYEQPAQTQQRTYERPAQTEQRTYERPSQPSYSAPSSSPSSGGGGNSGGGGGRRGGRF